MKSLSLYIILIALFGTINIPVANCTTSCKATPALGEGPDCSITCTGSNEHASCTGGLFSATCKCLPNNLINPVRDNPTVTSQEYTDAIALAQYLHSSSAAALQAMESSVNDAIIGVTNQNWSLYWSGSDSFFLQFDNLSSSDKSLINIWRSDHGYTTPL